MTDAVAPKPVLDWRVPILSIVALTVAAASGVALTSYRIDQLEVAQRDLKDVPAQLNRLDERTLQMQEVLKRLDSRP